MWTSGADVRVIKIVQVVSGITEEASGPSYSVVRLCQTLSTQAVGVRLLALDWEAASHPTATVELYRRWRALRSLGISPQLRLALERSTLHSDIIHTHGMWMMPNIYPGWVVRGTQCRLMVSPRGTLSPWALRQSKWLKQTFWSLLQLPAIRDAACFHATAESEYVDIRRAGLTRQPICIIPNGVDLPARIGGKMSGRRTLLFLGRIHPKKGVDLLLHAWQAIAPKFSDWELRIVGSDDNWGTVGGGYLRKMKELSDKLGLQRVVFSGQLYGSDKQRAYQEADLFVLPTHSENFGLTVAESLAAGTPVIVTKGAPWAGVERIGAGWWIEIGVDPLVACLEEAMGRSREELERQGLAGRAWMAEEFAWDAIATKMISVYKWIVHGGSPPECVMLT